MPLPIGVWKSNVNGVEDNFVVESVQGDKFRGKMLSFSANRSGKSDITSYSRSLG
jgi:hypothetical protein